MHLLFGDSESVDDELESPDVSFVFMTFVEFDSSAVSFVRFVSPLVSFVEFTSLFVSFVFPFIVPLLANVWLESFPASSAVGF